MNEKQTKQFRDVCNSPSTSVWAISWSAMVYWCVILLFLILYVLSLSRRIVFSIWVSQLSFIFGTSTIGKQWSCSVKLMPYDMPEISSFGGSSQLVWHQQLAICGSRSMQNLQRIWGTDDLGWIRKRITYSSIHYESLWYLMMWCVLSVGPILQYLWKGMKRTICCCHVCHKPSILVSRSWWWIWSWINHEAWFHSVETDIGEPWLTVTMNTDVADVDFLAASPVPGHLVPYLGLKAAGRSKPLEGRPKLSKAFPEWETLSSATWQVLGFGDGI